MVMRAWLSLLPALMLALCGEAGPSAFETSDPCQVVVRWPAKCTPALKTAICTGGTSEVVRRETPTCIKP